MHLDRQLAACRHGVARVEHEIEQGRGQLTGIDAGLPQVLIKPEFALDMFAERPAQQLLHADDLLADVDVPRHQWLLAREREQAPRQVRSALGGGRDALGDVVQLLVCHQLLGKVLRIAEDDGQQIVEIMRDAAGELTHRLHFLGLGEFLVELIDRGALALERLGGAVEQRHQPAEFAPRMGRRNPRAQIAQAQFRRHRSQPSDLTADAHGGQKPHAREQQQRGHREHRQILVQAAVGGGDQSVLGSSDQDIEPGIADRRRAGDGPDIGSPSRSVTSRNGSRSREAANRNSSEFAIDAPAGSVQAFPGAQQGPCPSCRPAEPRFRSIGACCDIRRISGD